MEKLESIIFGLKAEVERLQGKNEQLKIEFKKELAEHEEFTKKAKAEIERLTEESDEMFDRHAKENQAASILIEKRNNEIAELKKQVDDYKRKIEKGTLIELPCKVGDTVYVRENTWTWYNSYFNRAFIGGEFFVIGKITSIRFTDKSILIKVKATYRENQRLYKKKDYPISAIGKTVFLTREEAEKRLKELQG